MAGFRTQVLLTLTVAATLGMGAVQAQSVPARKPATAAQKPPTTQKKKPATTSQKKKPAATARKPAPPPPPPVVELIGYLAIPADTFRNGEPAGQFDDQSRRAAEPRFESQPVQGISSIKPGPTPGTWWALSDNGFGNKWNSSDYTLCIYLFDLRARAERGADSRAALQAVLELADPGRYFPWRIVNESTPERLLTGADVDPESLVVMPDGTFWVGDELGPWLLHFSSDGELLAPPVEPAPELRSPHHPMVLTGAAAAGIGSSRGFEAMELMADGKTLLTMLEGPLTGDTSRNVRVQRYDTETGKWLTRTHIYALDADSTSVSELARIDADRYVVLERDDLFGDAARAKRVYTIDFARSRVDRPMAKKLAVDLLVIGNGRVLAETIAPEGAPFRFPYYCVESIQVLDRRRVVVVNDNNFPATGGRGPQIKDSTEWLWLELQNPL